MDQAPPERRRDRGGARDARAEASAEKLRRAAEAGHPAERSDRTAERDGEAVDAHNELTRPEHSKGRPPSRKSNAGNDGP